MSHAAIAAELRNLAKPHALVRRADVRRDLLLDLARRIERAAPVERAPAPDVVVLGTASVTVERRARAKRRALERLDPMLELRRLLREEQAAV